MTLYQRSETVRDFNGVVVSKASVKVVVGLTYDDSAPLAVLYQDAAGLIPLANPLQADAAGRYFYWVDTADFYSERISRPGYVSYDEEGFFLGALEGPPGPQGSAGPPGPDISPQLANTANAVYGGGMVGFNPALAYGPTTVGGELKAIRSDLAENGDPFTGAGMVGYADLIGYDPGTVGDAISARVTSADLASTASGKGATLVGYLAPFTGAKDRTLGEKAADVVTSADFVGVDPTGTTDSSDGLNAFFSCGAKNLKLLPGTYKALKTLAIPVGVYLDASGVTIDGSSTTYASLTDGAHIKAGSGTWTQIQDLSASPAKGDVTITFASAPTLVPGDVICVYNPTSSSWSGFRTYYHAGEMARVAKVSGTTVTLQGALADDYTYTDVDVYRLDNSGSVTINGLTLKGLSDTSNQVGGIELDSLAFCKLENVKVSGCSYHQVSTSRCFVVSLVDCDLEEDFTSSFGGDYGLSIGNSQHVFVRGGYYAASRHGITTGGGLSIPNIPCRYIHINDADVASTGEIQAVDFHGNTEYGFVDGCVLNGGFSGGGDFISVTNNKIFGKYSNGGAAIYAAEMRGCNFDVSGNEIWNKVVAASRGAFVDIGGNTGAISSSTVKGGIISVRGNKFNWKLPSTAAPSSDEPIRVSNAGYNGSYPIECHIENNLMRSNQRTGYCEVYVTSGRPWDVITYTGNKGTFCGGLRVRHTVAASVSALRVDARGNFTDGAWIEGFYVSNVRDSVTVEGNSVFNGRFGSYVDSNLAANTRFVNVSNNNLFDNLIGTTSSSTTNMGFYVQKVDFLRMKDNTIGSGNQFIVVGSNAGFQIGETITGGTSGFSATVMDTRSTTFISVGRTSTGNFTVGETITGATSGASTTITTAQALTQARRLVLATIGSASLRGNVDFAVTTDSFTSVTFGPGATMEGSATYDPPNLADGAGATTTVTVTGAALGDYASASFSLDTAGITITAWVSAANTVSVRFQNESGGPLDIASGTLRATVTKP